jgi:hypothetical protein
MSTLTAIKETLQYIYDNREMLAKDKFSDVHHIPDMGYRVHKHAFVPKVLDHRDVNKQISEVIDLCFRNSMKWDAASLWLTIEK